MLKSAEDLLCVCVWLSITWHVEHTNSEVFGLRNFSLNMSNFPLSPPSSFPLWCAMSSRSGKCLASTNSLMMSLTLTRCILDSLPQNPNKLIDSKPICGTTQWEDPGCLMMDAKYVVGSKYWRVWHDLWATTKEGNIKEVPGVGVFRGDDMGMWRKLSMGDGIGYSP